MVTLRVLRVQVDVVCSVSLDAENPPLRCRLVLGFNANRLRGICSCHRFLPLTAALSFGPQRLGLIVFSLLGRTSRGYLSIPPLPGAAPSLFMHQLLLLRSPLSSDNVGLRLSFCLLLQQLGSGSLEAIFEAELVEEPSLACLVEKCASLCNIEDFVRLL